MPQCCTPAGGHVVTLLHLLGGDVATPARRQCWHKPPPTKEGLLPQCCTPDGGHVATLFHLLGGAVATTARRRCWLLLQ